LIGTSCKIDNNLKIQRVELPLDEIPRKWYNMLPDLPEPILLYKEKNSYKLSRELPHTYTKTASKLEFSNQKWIKIPDAIVAAYINSHRPSSLIRANRLETFLKTPARIYYKCESLPPVGTFKSNSALPQAYWAKKEGYKRTVFSGSAYMRTKFAHLYAAKTFKLNSTIFMKRAEYQQHKDQVFFIKKMFGADLLESPSHTTEIGKKALNIDSEHPGSNEILWQEVYEKTSENEDAVTVANSQLNHVLLTQTIIGLELEKQLKLIDEKPNILISSVGSGSNFFGLIAPFIRDSLNNKINNVKFLAVESETSSKLTNGKYVYTSMKKRAIPNLLMKTHDLDWKKPPSPIIGRGIQTKNTAPIISLLRHLGLIDTIVYPKDEKKVLEAANIFIETEGQLLAPESAYAVRATIDEAIKAKKSGQKKNIILSISGTSFLDFEEKANYAKFRCEQTKNV
jgi:tryptophan synthase beta chain